MSLASKLRIPAFAAATLIAAFPIMSTPAASASVVGYGLGTGSTAAAAEKAATMDLIANFEGCNLPPGLVYDRGSGTSWLAEVSSTCLTYR